MEHTSQEVTVPPPKKHSPSPITDFAHADCLSSYSIIGTNGILVSYNLLSAKNMLHTYCNAEGNHERFIVIQMTQVRYSLTAPFY